MGSGNLKLPPLPHHHLSFDLGSAAGSGSKPSFSPTSPGVTFFDGFEGEVIDPFWTIYGQYGTVELSEEQAHSGSQSIMMGSADAPPPEEKGMILIHIFSRVMKGNISIWLYDSTSGSVGLYAIFDIFNYTIPWGQPGYRVSVAIRDWDPNWYRVGGPTGDRQVMRRSQGWHQFEVKFGDSNTEVFIDGQQVASFAGDFGFDEINVVVSGPWYRPNANHYWDDFSLEATPAGVIEVDIDIKPGSDPNSINIKGHDSRSGKGGTGVSGTIPVAVLTTDDFDAADVAPQTVTLGDDEGDDTGVATRRNGSLRASLEDVNGDGRPDLVLHFDKSAMIENGDLSVETNDVVLERRGCLRHTDSRLRSGAD